MKKAYVALDAAESKGVISKNIYGHFSEHIGGVFYDGLYVGEDSPVENIYGFRKELVDSFRKISPGVLRWPGGCFAETYDWRDGIGPVDKRPVRLSWWYYKDGRTEPNLVGTHEFVRFCRLVGAEPYIAANMTSTWPLHIRDWIEYCNIPRGTTLSDERIANGDEKPFGVRYWGIGNENWGGGGRMSPENCADEYLRYMTICGNADPGNLSFIMCGADAADTEWTERLLRQFRSRCDTSSPNWGVSFHYYTGVPGSDPCHFDEEDWYHLLGRANRMEKILLGHRAAMERYDPERKLKLVVDEWGCWHKDGTGPSNGYNLFEQQSSMRDALVVAQTLNTFNNHCDIVGMANIAQLCNNLHSLYLAGGKHFVETPNYHVFDMYKTHQDARHIDTHVHADERRTADGTLPLLSASASVKDGRVTVTLANMSMTEAQEVTLEMLGMEKNGDAEITILTHDDPHSVNDFDDPRRVVPSGPVRTGLSPVLPPASVARICFDIR